MDFILGDRNVAIEVKGGGRVHEGDITGLRALLEEHRVKRSIVVSLEHEPRIMSNGIEILPWKTFLEQLWDGDFA